MENLKLTSTEYPNPKDFDTLEAFQEKSREVRTIREKTIGFYPANCRTAFERVLLKHYDRAHGTKYFDDGK